MCPAFALEFIFKHLAAGSFKILWEMASYVGIRGANGGRLRLEPRIARPPPRQKGPPPKDWSPPKDLWILGVEARISTKGKAYERRDRQILLQSIDFSLLWFSDKREKFMLCRRI